MLFGIAIICCSLFYSVMVATVYLSKNKIDNIENKIYSFLMKINIIGLILELACCFLVMCRDTSSLLSTLNVLVNKIFIIYLLTWEVTFTSYIFFISFNSRESFKAKISQNKNKIFTFILIFYLLMLFLVSKLPLYYFSDDTYVYSYGPATNLLVVMGAIFIGFDLFCLFKNINNIKNKKYYPLFILVLLMIFIAILRSINPGIIIINSVFAFVTVLMYFTIENPDLQMVEELLKNRDLVEKSLEDRSITLLTLSQKVRKPLKEIKRDLNYYQQLSDEDEKENLLKTTIQNIESLNFVVNDVLNISSMDVSKIKLTETEYSTKYFFLDIKKRTEQALNGKNLEFKLEVKNSLPPTLYGDSVKMKQVLMAIIYNAIKNTDTGFIDIDVDSITRYDVCRLIIDIKDSGPGMSLEKINELLKYDIDLDEHDFDKIDILDIDLSLSIKIVRFLGGTINIKSVKGKGSTFTIAIDQKVKLELENKFMKEAERYQTEVFKNKRVLVVDDDSDELKRINRLFTKYNINIVSCLLGSECLKRIENNEKYNLIILNDEMHPENALPILKQLKKAKIKTPVLVMLNQNKEWISKKYLQEGFDDIIKKANLENEVRRIFDKYL